MAQTECTLRPGVLLEGTLAAPGAGAGEDGHWYRVEVPVQATARALLNVRGRAPDAPASDASLVLELRDAAGQVLAREEGSAQGPVDVTRPASTSGPLLVRVHAARAGAPHPYQLLLQVPEDPDVHEPNDAQPVPVALEHAGEEQVGVATGYLAADGDEDRYALSLPAGKLLHVDLEVPEVGAAHSWQLGWRLLRPGATGVLEGAGAAAADAPHPLHLATVRRVTEAGAWTLVVQGVLPEDAAGPAPGDLQRRYVLKVRVLDEADVQDRASDNDTLARATQRSLEGMAAGSTGARVSWVGRLASVGDVDWYGVVLPASSVPTVLHYRLVQLETPTRFTPLPSSDLRQLHVFTPVTAGATEAARREACLAGVSCPRPVSLAPFNQSDLQAACTTPELPPLCLHSSRREFGQVLGNFEGRLPVPPHASALIYLLRMHDVDRDGADDREYRVEVAWLAEDVDEVARTEGGTEVPVQRSLEQTDAFPAPPDTAAYAVSGWLSHGHGTTQRSGRAPAGVGVRGPVDYDAVPSDVDSFVFQLPTRTAPEDVSWLVQVEVPHLPDGRVPAELGLGLTFCDGDALGGGVCTPVSTDGAGAPLVLVADTTLRRPWYAAPDARQQQLWQSVRGTGSTSLTLAPSACGCLERRFVRGGTLRVDVQAWVRDDHAPVNYTLRTGWGPYPRAYETDAGPVSCPAPVADGGTVLPDGGVDVQWTGGCAFTRQP